mmetsp:Transcript_13806/g.12241  ORF Transcript_13806/g.12241 Transcript_13806/m.12241 type:complete len:129 (-) Transcript_13806:119-505(-)
MNINLREKFKAIHKLTPLHNSPRNRYNKPLRRPLIANYDRMEDRDEDEDEVEVGMDEQDTQMEEMKKRWTHKLRLSEDWIYLQKKLRFILSLIMGIRIKSLKFIRNIKNKLKKGRLMIIINLISRTLM